MFRPAASSAIRSTVAASSISHRVARQSARSSAAAPRMSPPAARRSAPRSAAAALRMSSPVAWRPARRSAAVRSMFRPGASSAMRWTRPVPSMSPRAAPRSAPRSDAAAHWNCSAAPSRTEPSSAPAARWRLLLAMRSAITPSPAGPFWRWPPAALRAARPRCRAAARWNSSAAAFRHHSGDQLRRNPRNRLRLHRQRLRIQRRRYPRSRIRRLGDRYDGPERRRR
jgi:hypothetical protein